MRKFYLIIETPCGGDSGHRFLVSHADLTEKEISVVVANASTTPIGDDYVSVSQKVKQSLTNGTVREATESIVLLGVGKGELSASELASAQESLKKLFGRLRELTNTIQWGDFGRSIVIVRSELSQWLCTSEFESFSQLNDSLNPKPPRENSGSKSNRNRFRQFVFWMMFLLLLLVLFLAGLWCKGRLFDGASPEPPPPKTPVSTAFKTLEIDWDCTTEELVESLQRAADWEQPRKKDAQVSEPSVQAGEVSSIVDKINATQPPDSFFVSPSVENQEGFRRTFGSNVNTAGEAEAVRQWLFKSWQTFSELKRAALIADKYLVETDDEFAKFIRRVILIEGHIGLGVGFREPKTPLFERQDVMIYELLANDIRPSLSETGVLLKLRGSSNHIEPDDLLSLLKMLAKQREEITKKSDASRQLEVDLVHQRGRGGGAEVHAAYQSCEKLLFHLSTIECKATTSFP